MAGGAATSMPLLPGRTGAPTDPDVEFVVPWLVGGLLGPLVVDSPWLAGRLALISPEFWLAVHRWAVSPFV